MKIDSKPKEENVTNSKIVLVDAPSEFAWQEGKTAATIAFVNEASAYVATQPKFSPIVMLERYIERLKSGEDVLTKWLTVKDYMSSEHVKCMG